jgi:hypothetical protein
MVCVPGNPILLMAINKIVENVKNKYYGNDFLDVTGPGLLSTYFTKKEKDDFDMKHEVFLSNKNKFIFFNNYIVLRTYDGYLTETNKFKKVEHYAILWNKRQIYN